jgi:glycosyltransferase involved in cell wall biosynthesis
MFCVSGNLVYMCNGPLVSIITPTYNHEKFIGLCLESVLSQTYPHWEQIIIDDGSSDRTGDIASQYKDERIKYIRQNNRGIWRLGELYNDALRLAKGEFIAILEGDDFWPSNKLELQLKAHSGSSAVLSWGRAKIIDSQNRVLAVLPEDIRSFRDLSKEEVLGRLLFHNPMTSCTIICRRSALISIGGFKQPQSVPYVDGPTWLELSLVGDFLAIDEVLGCYRRHAMQVSTSMKAFMIKASLYSIEFYNRLPLAVRTSLAERVSDLSTRLEQKEVESNYYLGRAYLKEGKRTEARESFLKAIGSAKSNLKAKAVLGLICSLCGKDMEWLAEMLNETRMDGS